MSEIVVFGEIEVVIINQARSALIHHDLKDELMSFENNLDALKDLASSISRYPSILRQQKLWNSSRSIETMLENIYMRDIVDLIMHIPTKAILGQSYMIAKINFFFMIYYLSRDISVLTPLEDTILDIVSRCVFSLMVEEVFLSIISDKKISMHIRNNAGYLLANIWEYRIDYGVKEFAPLLNTIWRARESLCPNFGTMLGISELYRISEIAGPIWLEFLEKDDLNMEEVDSLREFLMGLTFEEMEKLSDEMEKMGKSSFSKEEIEMILGAHTMYPQYADDDPREMFRSFSHRKNNAFYRARGGHKGPKKTIEEYLMCYLLQRPEQWINI